MSGVLSAAATSWLLRQRAIAGTAAEGVIDGAELAPATSASHAASVPTLADTSYRQTKPPVTLSADADLALPAIPYAPVQAPPPSVVLPPSTHRDAVKALMAVDYTPDAASIWRRLAPLRQAAATTVKDTDGDARADAAGGSSMRARPNPKADGGAARRPLTNLERAHGAISAVEITRAERRRELGLIARFIERRPQSAALW